MGVWRTAVYVEMRDVCGGKPAAADVALNYGIYSGTAAELASGSVLHYNGIINLNNKTKDDMFIQMQVVPYSLSEVAVRSVIIELSEVGNPSNKILIRTWHNNAIESRAAAGVERTHK